ncbi:unnamed protein product [Haemonchus placei]|uniref:Transposase n=1 Tax=Haemonchus placei TaxID=6290 RepID=A0A0N4W2N7_HAEPC|nr:unnamed protein product [Haemonchus placei]
MRVVNYLAAVTEMIREYQCWRRHRKSLSAPDVLVCFLVNKSTKW